MKRFAQIFAGLLLVFILLLVGLVVFFPKEKIKNLVLQKIQEQTDLPIQIKDIGLSFFPHFAFHLQGFAVGGQEHLVFVSVEDFEIRSGLTAFLDKEINISDIIVQKPILKIYTKYSDQVSGDTEKDHQNNVELETKTHSDSEDIGFFITNFHIEDGELWIYDKNDQEEIKIKDLDQSLTIKLTPNKDLEINGKTSITEVWSKHLHMPAISVVMQNNLIFQDEQQKLVINNSTFTVQDLPIFLNGFIQGKEDGNVVADIALKTEPTELSSIFQLVPALQNQDWQTKGRFAVQGRINGLFVEDDFLGSFEKSQTNLLLTLEQGQIANKAHDVSFAPVSLETTITPLSIKLHKLHLASKNSNLDVTGHISNYLQEALVGLTVKANADLKEVQPWLDKKTVSKLKGQAKLDLDINGKIDIDQSTVNASLTLQDVSLYEPNLKYNIQNFSGVFTTDKNQTTFENITAQIEQSDFAISKATFSPVQVFLDEKRSIHFDVAGASKYIDYLDVLPKSEGASAAEKEPLVLPDIFYRLDGKGTYKIAKARYSGTDFEDVITTFELKKGKLRVNPLSTKSFDGSFKATGDIDFTPKDRFPFDMTVAMDHISLQKSLAFATSVESLVHLKQSLSANVFLDTKAKGELDPFLNLNMQTLSSNGTFSFKDANLANHPVQNKLSNYLSAAEFKEINVKQWSQKFNVADGKLQVNDLKINAQDFVFALDGYQSLDGSQNYNLNATLPEKFKQNIQNKIPSQVFNLFVKNDTGSFVLPFDIGGKYNSPTLSLNEDKIQKQAQSNAKDKIKSDLTNKKKQASKDIQADIKKKAAPSTDETKKKAEEKTKDIGKKLKKLF